MNRSLPPGLAAMLRAAADDDDNEGPRFPQKDAQLSELAIVLRDDAVRDAFEKGDVVEIKHARGSLKSDARASLILMFWRYLDGPADERWIARASDNEHATTSTFDCIIGCLNNGSLVFYPTDSAALRKVGKVAP